MNQPQRAAANQPRRPLHTNFTKRTLRHAKLAKKRLERQGHKGFFMKLPNLLQNPAAAAITVAVIATGAVGTYAAANWFNTAIGIKTDNTAISIDLSECKNAFLPGIDSPDMHNVQFKITGEPHISESDLQKQLLNMCEYNAVVDFYHSQPVTKNADLSPSKIVAIDDTHVTLLYKVGGKTTSKQFRLAADAALYNKGTRIQQAGLQVGDPVVFATPHQTGPFVEGSDVLQNVDTVLGIFVTEHDTSTAPGNGKYNFSYPDNNIMPLSMYNNLHKR